MGRRLAFVAVVLVLVFGAAQLVRPSEANPPIVAARTIEARIGSASALVPVLYRACGDCHSNRTEWRGPAKVAPLSWLMASAVAEGRRTLNLSDWAAYAPDQQKALLSQSCRDASDGKMPPTAYTALRPETRLSGSSIAVICEAAGKA